MIHGAHVIIYSKDAEADRAFLRDVLKYKSVDAGHGWLIFALPPAELGVHPSEGETTHELSLMCDDIEATVAKLRAKGIEIRGEPEDRGYGIATKMILPGGVEIDLYEPRHESPLG